MNRPIRLVARPCISLLLAVLATVSSRAGAADESAKVPVRAVLSMESPLMRCLMHSGLDFQQMDDPLQAIDTEKPLVVIVDAAPEKLKPLAEARETVVAFAEKGGWLMVCGLFPDGLAEFNRLVGVDHIIRPFAAEEVDLAKPLDPLLNGLSPSDVFLESGQWTPEPAAVALRADDMFSFIVDYDDIAPFCKLPGPEHWHQPDAAPGSDHWPQNMVNGLTYHWRFGLSFLLDKGEPVEWPMEFPREEEIVGFSVSAGILYHTITEIRLDFGDGQPVLLPIKPGDARQDFTFEPRRSSCVVITITKWNKTGSANVVSINNLWIKARRPPAFYERVKPLLNIGGLVKYPMGKGGIVLNELHVLESEENPANAVKKAKIGTTLLKNLVAAAREAAR